jgi:alkylhydroperoxidase family enzyme
MTRIRIVQESEARGQVKEQYDRIRAGMTIPMVPDVMKLPSLRPDFLRIMFDNYEAMFHRGRLPREVKEMIAVVVSQTNSCRY